MQTDIWKYLSKQNKPILLYGMGNGAEEIITQLKKYNKTISGVFASDGFVRGQHFKGYEVLDYKTAKQKFRDFIVLTAFGTTDKAVIENIKSIAKEQELYISDVPVYGNTVFTHEYYIDNLNDIKEIRKCFADNRSQEVFDAVIDFKLTGNIDKLFFCEDKENDEILKIIKLPYSAVIFDLGAYIGDTAEKFLNIFPNAQKIIACEPDQKNYKRLLENTEKYSSVVCENAAISYLNGEIHFGGEGGRNQSAYTGDCITKSITIDSLCEKYGKPDFIKFDIEGQELNGLIGAEETIKKYKPKLMVSAYHRSEDIVSIPKKVLSLRSDYKMYIRHFPCIPCWDTYYFFT